jgi:tetratricopeptide (TPR) repeat protein
VLKGADEVERLSGRAPQVQIELLDVFGSVLMQTGELQRALALRRRAVQLATVNLGPKHPDTLWLQVSLAHAMAAAGDNPGARELLKPAREQLARVAPESVAMAHALIHTARLESIRAPALAERSARQAMQLLDTMHTRRDGRPVDPWLDDNRAHGMVHWGRALLGLGRFDEGLQRLRVARDRLQALYGEGGADVDEGLAWQIDALWALGRVREADGLAVERLGRLETSPVRRPEWIAAAHLQRARLMLDAGRHQEARDLLDQALAERRRLADPAPHTRAETLAAFRLMAGFDRDGRPEDLDALAPLLRQNQVPPALRGELHVLLSRALARQGQVEPARRHLEQARLIARDLPGAWRLRQLLELQ